MLNEEADNVPVEIITLIFIGFSLCLCEDICYNPIPLEAVNTFGFSGVFLCFGSYIRFDGLLAKREEPRFVAGIICLGISALFWIEILFDYLRGVK